jgi:hypothetical protein
MIDRREASSALADITEFGARVRQALFYRRASAMLILWGVLTFAGHLVTFLAPSRSGYVWIGIMILGLCGSVAIGIVTAKRQGVNNFDARIFAAFVLFIAFGFVWSVAIGQFGPRQLGAFWTSYFMLPYILLGLWLGWAFVAIGSAVMALTFIGYFYAGDWFALWMAVVNGIGLILGGLWMRRS